MVAVTDVTPAANRDKDRDKNVIVVYCHRDTPAGQNVANEEVHRKGESPNVETV
jgi:hypothetical protein